MMEKYMIIFATALEVAFTATSTAKISGSLTLIEGDAFRQETVEEINIKPSGTS